MSRVATAREFFLEASRRNAIAQPASCANRPAPRGGRRRKRYVLVVEDDTDIRDVIKQELVDCGYRVRTARHGVEALKILDDEYYQPLSGDAPCLPLVILLDIHMPEMDGLNFLITLRKTRPQFDAVRAVPMSDSQSVTAFTRWAVQTHGLDVPDHALPKPFARDLLIERVAEHGGLPDDDGDGGADE